IIAGLISLIASVLAALQTFFNFSDVSAQHKEAASEYESIRHKLDCFILANAGIADRGGLQGALEELGAKSELMEQTAKKAPSIQDKVYDAVQTRVATRPILSNSLQADTSENS